MSANPKFCVNCRHFDEKAFGAVERVECQHPNNTAGSPNFVRGGTIKKPIWLTAQYCREDSACCGPDGKWFQPKLEAA